MNRHGNFTRKSNPMKGRLMTLSLILLFVSCNKIHTVFIPPPAPGPPGMDFRQEMRDFVQNISAYARVSNSNFIVIPQNGIELVTTDGTPTPGLADATYLAAISGTGQEDLYYGYDTDNVATPASVTNYLTPFLDIFKTNGKQVMAIDYCSTPSFMDNSYTWNAGKTYISFAADHRALDNIPAYPANPYNSNTTDITNLNAAKNFLYMINPSQFATKQDLLDAIKATNYDVVLIDLFFNDGSALSSADITSLKTKSGGGSRLVICYMSIGEAENYRYYWQSGWHYGNPSWLDLRNPSWPGNFKVRYWDLAWQAIIYGDVQTNGHDSYTKQILDAGFDGVYLDIIDAFEYWEARAW